MASRMLLRHCRPRLLQSQPLMLTRLSSTSTATATTTTATSSTSTATAVATTDTTNTVEKKEETSKAVSNENKAVEQGYAHGAYLWSMERASSLALVPLISTQFVYGAHPITDGLLGVVLPYHIYLGFESCIVDYIPKREYPRMHKVANWSLASTTALVMWGAYEFNTNEIGITEFIQRLFTS
ncbi:CybS-domain-containing protein, partial [Lichtheimia hyalospora FSU 10163]